MDPLKLEGTTSSWPRHTPPLRGKRWVLHPITTSTQAGHIERQRKRFDPRNAAWKDPALLFHPSQAMLAVR